MKNETNESDVIRNVNGRTMMSASMVLDRAREHAEKDHDPKKGKLKVSLKHLLQARKSIENNEAVEVLPIISFKEYKEIYEDLEKQIDDQLEESRSEYSANMSMGSGKAQDRKFRLKTKSGSTRGIFSDKSSAMKAHAEHPDRKNLVVEEVVEEAEFSPFDWKKNKTNTHNADGSVDTGTKKHIGTYGSETHKAPNDIGKADIKKAVGRPEGFYQGDYKIDKKKRESDEYKKALSDKVSASKKAGFEARTFFKTAMNDAIKKRQQELNKE